MSCCVNDTESEPWPAWCQSQTLYHYRAALPKRLSGIAHGALWATAQALSATGDTPHGKLEVAEQRLTGTSHVLEGSAGPQGPRQESPQDEEHGRQRHINNRQRNKGTGQGASQARRGRGKGSREEIQLWLQTLKNVPGDRERRGRNPGQVKTGLFLD